MARFGASDMGSDLLSQWCVAEIRSWPDSVTVLREMEVRDPAGPCRFDQDKAESVMFMSIENGVVLAAGTETRSPDGDFGYEHSFGFVIDDPEVLRTLAARLVEFADRFSDSHVQRVQGRQVVSFGKVF